MDRRLFMSGVAVTAYSGVSNKAAGNAVVEIECSDCGHAVSLTPDDVCFLMGNTIRCGKCKCRTLEYTAVDNRSKRCKARRKTQGE